MNAGSQAIQSAVPAALLLSLALAACGDPASDEAAPADDGSSMQALVDQYAVFRLEADLSHLSENDRQVVRLLIEAAQPMDGVFWQEAYGDKEAALALADGDEATRRFIEINYGPWDRLRGDGPFIDGVGDKPAGANFYPADMTAEEFEAAAADNEALRSLYTLVRRDDDRALVAHPYHEAFAEAHMAAAAKLREAAGLASDPGLAHYLMLRAAALETDDYQPSDMAWLDMKDNPIDVVIGPIETYEDQLFGAKAAHEGFVLIKDLAWSERLARFAALLPSLQESLPVPDEYKAETPGTDSDLNAYDAVYYAGDANAGAKTIAINLPNDEEVQLAKGTRRLQLKNAMQAKFDKIMVGIAEELIDEDQQQYVVFDAFFSNVMFHEVAHGLGIKNTINGRGTVREALREHASPMEEGKADVVGLHMVTQLFERGELTEHSVEHHYVTFLAGIFRSVRFGAASAHGRANMVRFNYFREQGAFSRDEATGKYRVDFDAMREAVAGLSELILTLQGDGDYEGVAALIEEKGVVPPDLQADLDRLDAAGIPRDIVFEQGASVLFGGS
ncbi:MAG: Zn-dependent hydrolase [Gemmatimonadetes bacterium]|nr:Zn-dependent hydrolase [Gemmatimonadota bacterium]MYB97142.1 Zn-dependent hydrolase [Gemmatimonadota bacterium]